MGSLTSIDLAARRIDEARTRLRSEPVDFDRYLETREDDAAHVKPAEDFRDALHEEMFGESRQAGAYTPWRKLDDKFRFRPGELTVWAGFNGHGKSMVSGYVLLNLLHQGERAVIASMEMKPRKTLARMCRQFAGTARPTAAYVDRFLDAVAGKLWLYDQQGETTPERIYGVTAYCAEKLGCSQVAVDSLMKVVRDEDDYNGQKRFVGKLQSLLRDLNVHGHLITHSRKRDDEKTRPGKQDNKGSGSIVDQTDNFVSVFKLPKKDDPSDTGPTHCLYFDKQRNGEWEGHIALWMESGSLRFNEAP